MFISKIQILPNNLKILALESKDASLLANLLDCLYLFRRIMLFLAKPIRFEHNFARKLEKRN